MNQSRRQFTLLVLAAASGQVRCTRGTDPPARDEATGYVIAQPCIGVKDTACVDVCPVDCIHPGKGEKGFGETPQLYIDPEECIHCTACVPACPVSAIFAPDELPAAWQDFAARNRNHYLNKT